MSITAFSKAYPDLTCNVFDNKKHVCCGSVASCSNNDRHHEQYTKLPEVAPKEKATPTNLVALQSTPSTPGVPNKTLRRLSSQLIQPFVDPVTHKKVRFVQSKSKDCKALMEETFDLEHLEEAFGGQSKETFDFAAYSKMMEDDEKRIAQYWSQPISSSSRAIAVDSKRPEEVLENGVAALKVEAAVV
jgi:hypothetical protein